MSKVLKSGSIIVAVSMVLTLGLSACGESDANTQPSQTVAPTSQSVAPTSQPAPTTSPTTSPPATTQASQVQWSMNVQVVGKSPVTITHLDAAKIGPVDIVASVKDGSSVLPAHTYKAILLTDLLKYLGVAKYSVITIEGAGVIVEITPDRVDAAASGFAWMSDGQALTAATGLVKWVNHNRGPKHWADNVTLITIIE